MTLPFRCLSAIGLLKNTNVLPGVKAPIDTTRYWLGLETRCPIAAQDTLLISTKVIICHDTVYTTSICGDIY